MQHLCLRTFTVAFALAVLTLAGCGNDAREEPSAAATLAVPASLDASAPAGLGPVVAGTAPPNPYSPEQIARGAYLVEFGGCNDCHTPWVFDADLGMEVPDMSRRLSGHPQGAPDPAGTLGAGDAALIGAHFTSFALPFGTIYAMNLTPDVDTGSGSWTEQMFVDIFRTGRHLGGQGRPVLPPMPWPNVASLSDEDLISVFAYLRSVPPISNSVPSPNVPEEVMWGLRDSYDRMLGLAPRATTVVAAR